MPRKSSADLTLGGPRFGRQAEPVGTLVWHHTELGRRTDDERYRIIRAGDAWQLLDHNWNALALPGTMEDMYRAAERLEAQRKAKAKTG